MKREIKFRRSHFTNKEKTALSHQDYWGFGINNSTFTSPSSNNFSLWHIDQQLTGLKDKNGKEIYEGDILKIEQIPCNFAIEWNNEMACHDWYVMTETKKQGGRMIKSIEDAVLKTGFRFSELVEVIGDIYKTPHLLTEQS